MVRVFLDANILVSAALTPGSTISTLWTLEGTSLVTSPYVLAEARRNVPGPDATARLEQLIAGVAVLPAQPADFALAHEIDLPTKDRLVYLAAVVAHAHVLLTGDLKHFGALMGREINGVTVMLPVDYLRDR